MAKTRAQKEHLITLYKELLDKGNFVMVKLSTKLPANPMNQIRLAVRDKGGKVIVLKNKVFQKVAHGYEGFEDLSLQDVIAVIYAEEDLVSVLKEFEKINELVKQELAIRGEDEDFIKSYKAFEYFLGYMEGKILSAREAAKLSSLPSKEELYGQLAGTLAGVMRGFMHVLNGNTLNFMYVLQNLAQEKDK